MLNVVITSHAIVKSGFDHKRFVKGLKEYLETDCVTTPIILRYTADVWSGSVRPPRCSAVFYVRWCPMGVADFTLSWRCFMVISTCVFVLVYK